MTICMRKYQELKMMSILDPLTCGFLKVITFKVFTAKHTMQQESGENVHQFKNRILDHQYNTLHSIFGDAIFNVPFNTLRNKYHQIVEEIRGIAIKSVIEKNEIIKAFDIRAWSQLSPAKKGLHSIVECLKKLPIYPSEGPCKRTSSETKSRKIRFNKRKIIPKCDKQDYLQLISSA